MLPPHPMRRQSDHGPVACHLYGVGGGLLLADSAYLRQLDPVCVACMPPMERTSPQHEQCAQNEPARLYGTLPLRPQPV